MKTPSLNSKVDAYIASAAPFAQPILEHLRQLVHRGCPQVEETIKWKRPFFEYRGSILGNMAAFQKHCSFGFWGEEIASVLRGAQVLRKTGMGSLGTLTSVQDLPSDDAMLQWVRQAATFVESGQYTSPIAARRKVVKAPKPAVEAPAEFLVALQNSKQAAAVFAAFSPTGQREYVQWISEAKRPETRDRRIVTAIHWIQEGKQRNWKYQDC